MEHDHCNNSLVNIDGISLQKQHFSCIYELYYIAAFVMLISVASAKK
jgi:hypothetical protein